jgi:hypothetical protein
VRQESAVLYAELDFPLFLGEGEGEGLEELEEPGSGNSTSSSAKWELDPWRALEPVALDATRARGAQHTVTHTQQLAA